jgi:hypothetical protein
VRRGPFDDDLPPDARRDLGRRLVVLLREGPLDVRGMAAGLGVEPEVVVAALREARAASAGTLRSTIHLGRVTWWWEADGLDPDVPEPALTPGLAPEPAPELEAARGRRKGKASRKKR